MPLDHYVTLGRSGLRVSPLCLGAMTFGEDWGWGSSVKDSEAIMDRFFERGGNFLDTANAYTKGHSEKIIGDHVGRHPGRRDRLVLATKFTSNLFRGDPNGGGMSRKAIVAQCEESLRRLQTPYIDLYWLHAWDATTPIEETLRALDDLVTSGKVRYLGFSDTPAWKCAEAQTIARGVLSGKYTRAGHGAQQAARGAWATSALGDKAYAIIDELARIAGELDSTPSRVALAWVQGRPGVTSTIIGARTLAQLEDNLAAADVVLTPAQTARLDALSTPALNFPADFLANGAMFLHGGTTINGRGAPPGPLSPEGGKDRY